jgi:tRNA pseudouridine32 synthase/23S rRNA pseudouridine746 synthase
MSAGPEKRGEERFSRIEASFPSRRWCWEIPEYGRAARTCEEELVQRLPHIPQSSWSARFDLGGVYVAGRAASPSTPLTPPCRLEYYEPTCTIAEVSSLYPSFDPAMVIYRDEDIGVVCKPPGLPTTAPRDQVRFNLMRYLSEYLGRSVHLPSRLDVGVGGVLLFSLSERMNRYLQRAYDRRAVERYYVAELQGVSEWNARDVTLPIGRDPRHAVLRRVVTEGGEAAHTRLTVLSACGESAACGTTVVQAEPLTGRTHQIRVHCLAEQLPIVGDPFYWDVRDQIFDSGGIRLASYALRFYHPYRRELMTFEVPDSHGIGWLRKLEAREGRVAIRYRERRGYEGSEGR